MNYADIKIHTFDDVDDGWNYANLLDQSGDYLYVQQFYLYSNDKKACRMAELELVGFNVLKNTEESSYECDIVVKYSEGEGSR